MMTCFEGITTQPVFWAAGSVGLIAAIVMISMLWVQRFRGKLYYALTFFAMIYTLLIVGAEASAVAFDCQYKLGVAAWLGNALVPVAWCFFVYAYVHQSSWLGKKRVVAALVLAPVLSFAFAATNTHHGLVYDHATTIPPGARQIDYIHGPGFYVIMAVLYAFVGATYYGLYKGFRRSRRSAWPLLTMLAVVTMTPLAANAAYIFLGFTIFGLDPTSFMFSVGIFAFTFMLLTNKTLDMASVGQSVLFNTMSEAVVLVDNNKNVVLMNTAAKKRGFCKVPKDEAAALLATIDTRSLRTTEASVTIDERVYDPRVQEIESPLDPDGTILGWSVTLVDITDRIAITRALENALLRADEANRAKDEFISAVSHELRTPLTSLKGGLALALSGRLGDMDDRVRSPLEIAQRNGVRLSRLVDNILLSQKIDGDALSLDQQPVDLGALLKDSLEENQMFAAEQRIKLVRPKGDQSAIITGDAFALRQIIDNLVSNAIKFSDPGSIVEGALSLSDGHVRLSIKDNGRGIPDGMEDQVFGRFAQVKNGGQFATQGSGLGLHISQQLAQQMSGKIFYESEVGQGSVFHMDYATIAAHQAKVIHAADPDATDASALQHRGDLPENAQV